MEKTIHYKGVRTQIMSETRSLEIGDILRIEIESHGERYILETSKNSDEDFHYCIKHRDEFVINWQDGDLDKLIALANQFMVYEEG